MAITEGLSYYLKLLELWSLERKAAQKASTASPENWARYDALRQSIGTKFACWETVTESEMQQVRDAVNAL